MSATDVQVVDAPGASVVAGQEIAPAVGSVTATEVRVTVPVFLTRNDHAILSPRSVLPLPLTSVTAAVLVSGRVEVWATGVDVEELLDVTVVLAGFLPVAVAVLVTTAASPSACEMVYAVVVHVVEAPRRESRRGTGDGAGLSVGHGFTVVMVTVPVFLTRNDQVIVSPASLTPSALATIEATVFCRDSAGLAGMVVVRDDVASRRSCRPSRSRWPWGTEPASVSAR